MVRVDYLIGGGGIIGLTLAHQIKSRFPGKTIAIFDKEPDIALHASGRNSGVLHSGIYYASSSLKAKFCVEGNRRMREYCRAKNLPINECGKLVIATQDSELPRLDEIEKRANQNGGRVQKLSREEAEAKEPNIRHVGKALYAPDTATIDPVMVCNTLKSDLASQGVSFHFNEAYRRHKDGVVETTSCEFEYGRFINCAGLYSDKIAHDFGRGLGFTLLPFKGLYLKYTKNKTDIRTNIYPVPDLRLPFLGVHFTKTVDGTIKIGPTAIPAFWRENYTCFSRFKLDEFIDIMLREAKLFVTNAFHFRDLAFIEMRKYFKSYFIGLAEKLVKDIDPKGFTEYTAPGIRAQLLNMKTSELVQDFLIDADEKSVHVLNAVSPGFTCSFPFADHIIDSYLQGVKK